MNIFFIIHYPVQETSETPSVLQIYASQLFSERYLQGGHTQSTEHKGANYYQEVWLLSTG